MGNVTRCVRFDLWTIHPLLSLAALLLTMDLPNRFCVRVQAADPASAPQSAQFTQPPTWNPSPNVPLAGRITFATSRPASVQVQVRDRNHTWSIPVDETPRESHDLIVLGLRPGRAHEVLVTATVGDQTIPCDPLIVTTPELPDSFPTLRVVSAHPDRMEPGVTLFNVLRWEEGRASRTDGWFIIVDHAGEVVWYLRLDAPGGAIRQLDNGRFLFLVGARPTGMREIDLLGNTTRQWRATGIDADVPPGDVPVATDTFHHDFYPMENGNLLVLSTEARRLERFPASERQPKSLGPADVIGDVVIEMQPDGTIVKRWPLLDILDPLRIGWGSLTPFWDLRAYTHLPRGTKDWSHANTVVHDPRDDSLVVCLRHQDAIVKIDRATLAVKWILGPRAGWRGDLADKVLKPEARLEWPYHAHGVKFTPQGTLLVFDNGNCRAMPPDRPQPASDSYSRAVEYAIDEQAGTIRQVWSHDGNGPDRFFSAFVGDADWLPQTGNVLITDGGRLESHSGEPVGEPPGAVQWARIVEVTHDSPDEIVFELHVSEKGTNPGLGSSVYRAERLPGLYPESAGP
jgi:arylsulfate sulfotransferase